MASPEAHLPIDTEVKVPAAVAKAAAAADVLHKAAYKEAPADTPQPETPPPQPEAAPAAEPVAPQSPPQPQSPPADKNYEHMYLSMKGRFDQSMQTVGSLQQQLSEMSDELMRRDAVPMPQRQLQQSPQRRLTDADLQSYGPELIDLIRRTTLDTVEPEISQVRKQQQQVVQRVTRQGMRDMYRFLDNEIPDWRQINTDPRFISWCRLPDLYSGTIRGDLLNVAFKAADAPRVAAFFKGFLAEEVATGQRVDPTQAAGVLQTPTQPAVALETLVAPGKAKPASGDQPNAAQQPIITRDYIKWFYSQPGRMHYRGRDKDRARDEQMIFSAQNDGRVQG